MRKKIVWITYCLLIALMGCGSESSDPTARIASLKAEPSEIAPGGSVIITAEVVKAVVSTPPAGTTTTTTTTTTATVPPNAAWGVNVTFKLLTANGGRLSALTQKTDGSGVAMVVYTAGNNYNQDIVQATLENDNSATVVITKTGVISGPVLSEVSADPTSVSWGQHSKITIKVTDGGNPVGGEYVDIQINRNSSGASLIIPNHYTDAQGQVVATYVAGSLSNDVVTDVVQARVTSSGSVNSVIVTVNPGRSGPVISALSAAPASVSWGQQSIITIKVTDNAGKPVGGEYVDIEINPNNSGAFLIIPNHYTDAQGQVVATYVAGSLSDKVVTDVVQAQVTSSGSVNSVIITVNPVKTTVTP